MNNLKLGILGMSEGNGHPYSWSAIFNGYDKAKMSDCPFPVIPEYLALQNFPKDCIQNARVTHIWTQEKQISEKIAAASLIENIVDNYNDMIGEVDGILLARDDAENHYEMSKSFLDAGLPVYIDKPFATNLKEAKKILKMQKYPGQIFSCSALRYSNDLKINDELKSKIGEVKFVFASTSKYWHTYSVHLIEPVLKILNINTRPTEMVCNVVNDRNIVSAKWENDKHAVFCTMGKLNSNIVFKVYGEKRSVDLIFNDTFFCFRESLKYFINGVNKKQNMISQSELLLIVDIIERGFGKKKE